MFAACGAHVEELHRESFGNIELDMLGLQQGQWMHLPLDILQGTHSRVLCDMSKGQGAVVVPD